MTSVRGSPCVSILLVVVMIGGTATTMRASENIDPDDDGSQYAYGENVGWLNAELDTDADGHPDEGVEVTDKALTGWIWGENVGWISLSCESTSSCGSVDYAVTNDGCGNLSGYAWGENIGWINLDPSEGYGVRIDPTNGDFSGRAWAENVGWISFASVGPNPFKMKTAWVRMPPAGSSELTLTHSGTTTTLTWTAMGDASEYDVVLGDLRRLHLTGNFTAATLSCLAENQTSTSATHSMTPDPGAGYWFLVRGVNCGGNGSYDSGGTEQDHPRDSEIDSASGACL